MKKKIGVALALPFMAGLVLALVMVAYAQGPEPAERPERTDVDGSGLADPAPSGFSVLYMFTGVANDITDDDQVATTIHCTNFGTTSVDVEIQLFSPASTLTFTATETIPSNQTKTFSTQNTFYREDVTMNTNFIEQGSGRVLATQSNLICTAQVLQPIEPSTPFTIPLFMTDLEMFRP